MKICCRLSIVSTALAEGDLRVGAEIGGAALAVDGRHLTLSHEGRTLPHLHPFYGRAARIPLQRLGLMRVLQKNRKCIKHMYFIAFQR